MKRAKHILAMLLVLALMLSLAACGSSGQAAAEASAAAADSEAVPAAPDAAAPKAAPDSVQEAASAIDTAEAEPAPLDMDYSVELPISEEGRTFTMWAGIAPFAVNSISSEDDMQLYGKVAEMTGISFDVTVINGAEEQDQFNLMVASGDYKDIVTTMDYYTTGITGALNDDVIVDLYDYAVENAPHYMDCISRSPAAIATLINEDGQMGTIATTYQEVGLENYGISIRGDWLREMGAEKPETYDELYDYLVFCHDNYGSTTSMSTDGNYDVFSMGFGVLAGTYTTFDDKVEYYIQRDGYYDYLETMAKWYQEGLIYQDFYTLTDNTANGSLFCNGTVCLNNVGASVMNLLYELADPTYGAEFIGIKNPVVNKGEALPCSPEVPFINDDDAWAITSACDPEGIPDLMKLVDFMYSDTGALMWNYGTEGESFIYNDAGRPEFTEKVTAPSDGTMSAVAQYYYCSIAVPSRNDMRKSFYSFDDIAWEALDIFASEYDGSNCYPSAAEKSLTTEESEEYASVSSDVETYVDAEVLKFVTGAAPLTEESYQEFVDNATAMGLEQMVAIYQASYDRYLEKVR